MGALIGIAAKVIIVLLMVAMGLRLTRESLTMVWRNPRLLGGSVAAAFIVVPLFTYVVFQVLPLTFAAKAGLFVLAIAPGAPMIHTAATRRSPCSAELAASFQVEMALLVTLFAPLWLFVVSRLTGTDYHMNPLVVLRQVSEIQLIPILIGLAIHLKWPGPAERVGTIIEKIGLIALTALLLVILVFLAPRIVGGAEGWEVLAAALVAIAAVAAGHYLVGPDRTARATIATADAQRNVGLALAIAAWNLPSEKEAIALVMIIYVLVAVVVQAIYVKIITASA